jgi:hypothetical protein
MFLVQYIAFRKSCRLCGYAEKYGRTGQPTDDNLLQRVRFGCWITKATATYTEYIILIAYTWKEMSRQLASVLLYT